jgi:hypothetical protein
MIFYTVICLVGKGPIFISTDDSSLLHKSACGRPGLEARVVMHENDHINGVLFIDLLNGEMKTNFEPFLQKLYNRIHDGTEL